MVGLGAAVPDGAAGRGAGAKPGRTPVGEVGDIGLGATPGLTPAGGGGWNRDANADTPEGRGLGAAGGGAIVGPL